MRLHVPLLLRCRLLASLAALVSTSASLQAVTISKNVTLDDTSSLTSAAVNVVAGTAYGRVTAASALTLNGISVTVNHGAEGSSDTWAGFVLTAADNNVSFTFTNTTLSGNGNLAFAFRSGSANVHPSMDISTLDGSGYTGRILLMDQWNNGLTANYAGTLLQNAEIVLAQDGSQPVIGGAALGTGTNRYPNVLKLTGSASLAGISAEPKGSSSGAQESAIQTTGAGTHTLTLTGGCTTNQNYVFAGNAGTASAYVNLVLQGGSQTFSGQSFFGTVTVENGSLALTGRATLSGDIAVSGGTLTLGSATTLGGNAAITGGTLDFAGAVLNHGASLSIGGGSVNNLLLNAGITLSRTAPGGTLENMTLNGGTVSFAGGDGAAYSLSGTLGLESLTTLDFTGAAGYGDGTALFEGVSFGSDFVWNDEEWFRYFTLAGNAQDWKVVYDAPSNSLVLASNTALQLTWDNADNTGIWNAADANWGDEATVFHKGDSVTFSGTSGRVTVGEGGVMASRVTVTGQASLELAGGPVEGPVVIEDGSRLTLNADLAGAVTLDGASTLVVGTGTLDGAVTMADAASTILLTHTDALSSAATIAGAGTVTIDWQSQSGQINSGMAGFTGTLKVAGGRYEAGNAATTLKATSIVVENGGQFSVTGGTWSQSFTLAGEGWTSAPGDVDGHGALRFDGGTLSGSLTLSADAAIAVGSGKTGTVNGAIAGNGHALSKWGAGTLALGNSEAANLDLVIEEGTLSLAQNKKFTFGTVTVKGGATFQNHFDTYFTIAEMNMEDNSTLDLNDCGSSSHRTLTFTTMNVRGTAHVKNQTYGDIHMAGTVVGDNGTLHFTTGSGGNAIYLDSALSGTLDVVKDSGGTLYITNAANTCEGSLEARAGTISVSGQIRGGSNTYAATGGGLVAVSGNGRLQNDGVILRRNGTGNATIANATVGASTIVGGSSGSATLANASIDVTATAYAVEGITLDNSNLTLKQAGSVTLSGVTLKGASQLAGDATVGGVKTFHFAGTGNTLTLAAGLAGAASDSFDTGEKTLTSVYVYDVSSHFADVTLTGHLDLDVAALLDTLPGSYKYVAFDFGADNNVLFGEDFTAGVTPNAFNDGTLAGTVSGHVVYLETQLVPEPSSAGLVLLGMAGCLVRRRRKRH